MSRRCRVALSSAVAGCAILALQPVGVQAAPSSLSFAPRPARAVAGQSVTLGLSSAKPGAVCTLAVGYGKSGSQSGLVPKAATNGRATWSWVVPDTVQANFANVV